MRIKDETVNERKLVVEFDERDLLAILMNKIGSEQDFTIDRNTISNIVFIRCGSSRLDTKVRIELTNKFGEQK